jgi:hypothetical protein
MLFGVPAVYSWMNRLIIWVSQSLRGSFALLVQANDVHSNSLHCFGGFCRVDRL